MTFAWIESHRHAFPVRAMCDTLDVSASGFYACRVRRPGPRQRRREVLRKQIAEVHVQTRGVYGSPQVHRDLAARGVRVCENTVARLMRADGLRSKRVKRFVPRTTESKHAFQVAQNLLDRDFKADSPNRKWVCDITYVPTQEGWLYLAAVLDLYSRKIVGWSMADHLRVTLVEEALKMALARRTPTGEVLHHSDRGVQYACDDYQRLLKTHGLVCSMSRTGDCYDNAAMESFWSTLKTELVHHAKFASRAEARRALFDYMEVFYNRQRRYSSIGYVSPETFEAALN
ncbi:MAG: IS3 family transposase [Bryobacteraceae bacterium]|nr:IS3 family transposase [Planctomycetota bacterium]NUN04052.1 IS3 family transposase [Bryobacteraceae bacterium]